MPTYKIPKLVMNPPNKHEKYYEATIQLRNPPEEAINYLNNQLKNNIDVFISNIKPQKDGFDILISSQRFARSFGNKIKRAFKNVEVKMSRKIFTRNRMTSKDVYRVTVFLGFKTADTDKEAL